MVDMVKSPTFFVDADQQRNTLSKFQKRDQQLSEEYQKYKPLCFSDRAYQRTHPAKSRAGHRDADRTVVTPMMLGVADGVSQIEEFGIDASELPQELLATASEIAMNGLIPDGVVDDSERYDGPIPLLRQAFENTESLGSTTVVLAIMDNVNTTIHGKLHPMVAVITVGDCELLMLRRRRGRSSRLEAIFHTEMQRIDGHSQQPLQLARVDDRIDPDFDDSVTVEVIERGSAVHCISAYEGDIVVMGSDGVFDNLFLDEIVEVCNEMMRPPKDGKFEAADEDLLAQVSQRLVSLCHSKTEKGYTGVLPEAPIGSGGKVDDTSVVVAEVIEWSEEYTKAWTSKDSFGWGLFDCRSSTCKDVDAYDCEGRNDVDLGIDIIEDGWMMPPSQKWQIYQDEAVHPIKRKMRHSDESFTDQSGCVMS
jgi:protein phosphatase PTC7